MFVECCVSVSLFLFCKQKTAYEMRISDWSSDVCSSDLNWWFRKPHEMIEPSGFDTPLNPDNHFVRRGQVLATMLDAFARHQRRRNAGFDLATPPRDAI